MNRPRAVVPPQICLDAKSTSPIYRQIYDWFQQAILEGRLRAGQRMPSTRALAVELKVSRIPVLAAYEQLQAEGYLQSFIGAGTCVTRSIPVSSFRPVRKAPAGAARRNGPRRISRDVERAMSSPLFPDTRVIGAFRACVPALERFPSGIWSALLARHTRRVDADLMTYGDPMGYAPFRETIAEYLGSVRAVRCDASQVMVIAGSQHGLQLVTRTLIEPRDSVWLEDPGYPRARRTLLMAGASPVPVPVDRDGLDVEAGISRHPDARAAYITPSHQYPTGVTMSATRRMLLLDWAARTGSWIIEDDYDSEYRFNSRPVASLQGLDSDDRVIYIGTLSKVLFPALRVGYMVIPKDLLGAFRAAREMTDMFSSTLFQAALTDFIREGHFARHIRRMRMLYAARCEALTAAIRRNADGHLEIISAEAGMHLTVLLPPGIDDVAISRKAAEIGICANPLSTCYLQRPKRGGLILGYGGTDVAAIARCVERLMAIVREEMFVATRRANARDGKARGRNTVAACRLMDMPTR
jgi:GntR family transcriptional regulator / MocR family aminotransferase